MASNTFSMWCIEPKSPGLTCIETSYRIKDQARIRSTTKNPVLRLLYVAMVFILVNLWVYLLWQSVSATRRGGRLVFQEPL